MDEDERCLVLDIGAGTGLLTMMACKLVSYRSVSSFYSNLWMNGFSRYNPGINVLGLEGDKASTNLAMIAVRKNGMNASLINALSSEYRAREVRKTC